MAVVTMITATTANRHYRPYYGHGYGYAPRPYYGGYHRGYGYGGPGITFGFGGYRG